MGKLLFKNSIYNKDSHCAMIKNTRKTYKMYEKRDINGLSAIEYPVAQWLEFPVFSCEFDSHLEHGIIW